MDQAPKPDTYDGFYFLPADQDDSIELHFFDLQGEYENGVAENKDLYHIAFFDRDASGQPKFDASFEAVIGDPWTYVNNLIGAETYGCILRKTDKSGKWFDDYLTKALQKITIRRMKVALESIANN
jgi:hypothetical protein